MKATLGFLLFPVLFLVSACGSNVYSYHSEGLERPGLMDGTLFLSNAGVDSGKNVVSIQGTGLYVDVGGSSPEAVSYLRRLESREIQVGKTLVSGGALYSIRFAGSFDQGPCPGRTAFECPRVQLQEIIAY